VNQGTPFYVTTEGHVLKIGNFVSNDTSRVPLMMQYDQDKDFLVSAFGKHGVVKYDIETRSFAEGIAKIQKDVDYNNFASMLRILSYHYLITEYRRNSSSFFM
jgi:hypothetical protein